MRNLRVMPDTGDKEFINRADAISNPISSTDGYIIKKGDIYYQTYTWDPTLGKKIENLDEFHKIEIPTLHAYSYHGFFKPTCVEVLAVLPKKLVDLVTKSGTTMYYSTSPLSYDINEVVIGSYHIGITTLYLDKRISINKINRIDFLEKYKSGKYEWCDKFDDSGEIVVTRNQLCNYVSYDTVLLIDDANSTKSISQLLNEQMKSDNVSHHINEFSPKTLLECAGYKFYKVYIFQESAIPSPVQSSDSDTSSDTGTGQRSHKKRKLAVSI
jgi:hypothetical protein